MEILELNSILQLNSLDRCIVDCKRERVKKLEDRWIKISQSEELRISISQSKELGTLNKTAESPMICGSVTHANTCVNGVLEKEWEGNKGEKITWSNNGPIIPPNYELQAR